MEEGDADNAEAAGSAAGEAAEAAAEAAEAAEAAACRNEPIEGEGTVLEPMEAKAALEGEELFDQDTPFLGKGAEQTEKGKKVKGRFPFCLVVLSAAVGGGCTAALH